AGHLHHPALRDLHPLRGLYRARADGDDPALQRHAVLAVDGLRPRDGQHAHAAGQPAAARISAVLQAAGWYCRVAAPGLCVPADRLVLGHHPIDMGLSHGAAGPDPVRPDAGLARHADLLRHQAAGEFRRRHELRDLPDVLRLLRALPALARTGGQPVFVLSLRSQSLHPCGRTDPLRAVRPDQLALAGR
ncbi:hypothetical protein KXV85_002967, partial [Aspergillus fumigatus]